MVQRPGKRLLHFPLQAGSLVIGRDSGCDLVLDSSFVSRRHARLELTDGGYQLTDEGSHNGILVNGRRLAGRHKLQKGDEIAISDFLLTYLEVDEQATQPYEPGRSESIRIDEDLREAWIGPQRVQLSSQEFQLLVFLHENKNRMVGRAEIGERIWGTSSVGGRDLPKYDDNMIHKLVSRLKAKLEASGGTGLILNQPGFGYRLDA